MKQMLAALTFALLAAATPPAQAQPRCLERSQALDLLENRFGETRRAMGVAQGNAVVEVFASRETGNWTITATLPNGMTCLLASGHGFESLDRALPTLGTPV
jgi:hypothetical protein